MSRSTSEETKGRVVHPTLGETAPSPMTDWFADDSLWTEIDPFEFTETVIAAGHV